MGNDTSHARLHRLDQISFKQLGELNRDQTVVLLPIGMQPPNSLVVTRAEFARLLFRS